ncbi:MAG: haloalkane dehalogenase [Candidatus Binatia bacterium]
MKALRTPDDRFENLPGYPFKPHYVDVPDPDGGALRMHYLDEGPRDAAPVLLLHGEPSWSYLYRKMIPGIVEAGYRTVAPDLIGFGRSDKPVERGDYTYQRHVDWVLACIEQLDLRDITLFCQDWGGLIGLRIAATHGERFARIVAANTFLPTGNEGLGDAFVAWREYSQTVEDFDAGIILQGATVSDLSEDVMNAYRAPFPDDSYKAGARQFPAIVPDTPDNPAVEANAKAWESLRRWDKPFLTAFSDKDPVMAGADIPLRDPIPGARGQPHTTIIDGGHFLQEDKGEELVGIVVDFIRATAG